ncbi:uncharacterized protein [Zea mays]|uniref:uncharacterized protein n=1 Tax=Zea mays TaxID=4577 RepID=UPI0009A9F257|nr:uncharacterized protein LOC109941410 [Zea mays]|eukprot:XP_020397931.1 uncharacterized protein LOC109941410 [Zea mays]
MQQPILLSSPTKQRAPSSLFSVVPAGCSTECTANRALQQPSRSFSTPLVACRRSSARCAAPSATPSKPVLSVNANRRARVFDTWPVGRTTCMHNSDPIPFRTER